MEQVVKIQSIRQLTHDVRSYHTEKPADYQFIPGQATEISVNKPEWKEAKRPFTFTSLNEEPTLEFVIKSYPQKHGVTEEIGKLQEGDSFIVRDIWGAIAYKGPGYFIAGGAGITPFIAILRQLQKENRLRGNKLFLSNKTAGDIILREELRAMLGDDNVVYLLTQEKEESADYIRGRIDEAFLRARVDDFKKHFYVCGPKPMTKAINAILETLGASPELLVFEQ